jgi:hypothetical protein
VEPATLGPTPHDPLLEPYASRTAVLMPSFGTCRYRLENQRAVLRWYTTRGITVILGTDTSTTGFFSRARAINTAARETRETHDKKDLWILADNDLIPSVPHLSEALSSVCAGAYNVVTPHQWTLHTSFAGRDRLLSGQSTMLYRPQESGSRSYVVLKRASFEAMNGMDERFEGWGPEDKAFMLSAHKQLGRVLDMDGSRLHLWHPMDQSKRNRVQLMKNRALCKEYEAASGDEVNVLARQYGPLYR